MSPHRRLSPLRAAMHASAVAALPALVSASSSRSRSKHRHMHLHKNHAGSDSSDSNQENAHEHQHHHHHHDHGSREDDKDMGELRRRADLDSASSASLVVQIVQTVSVVQVIDAQGSIITLSTASIPFPTQAEAIVAGTTADSSDPLSGSSSPQTLSGTAAAAGATGSPGPSGATVSSAITAAGASLSHLSSAAAATAQGSSAFANGTLTSVPIPLTTGPSTVSANSTSTHLFGNSTSSTFHSLFANRTHSSSASSSFASSSSLCLSSSAASSGYSSSLYSSATGSSSAFGSEATGGVNGAGGAAGSGAATGSGAGAAPTSTTSNDDTSSNTPTSVLVGSVIGGLAGLALLLVVALYLLKMKRKKDQGDHHLLTDGDDAAGAASGAARGIPGGPGSGGAGPLGRISLGLAMSEARTGFLAPFASALASGQRRMSRGVGLPAITAPAAPVVITGSAGPNTGGIGGGLAATAAAAAVIGAGSSSPPRNAARRNTSPTSPPSPLSPQSAASDSPTTERSFYRVSGRKLPSVLQHGGDGYDDPRQSVMSTNTVNTSYTTNTAHMSMYRDSRGFFGGAGGPSTTPTSRYAVGSPMRPESGVPVFHTGPAKLISPLRAPASRQGSFIQDDGASVAGSASARNLASPPGPGGYFDPVGRSLISQDGSRGSRGSVSRGSVSRFTEDIP